ncbi:hypothetical protein ACUNV4_16390 [Granulosicoccus sp. 3-233]|uniref:hypothetical protein n=1 Tax=Granulosicoccus sp. 3-233 TaxID=3417969 RepID=UPI003D340D6B
MSRYATLFELSMHHAYMGEMACPALRLEPLDACRIALARAGLLIRSKGGVLQVLHDETLADQLAELSGDSSLTLVWYLRSSEPSLAGCSEPPLMQTGKLLYLESDDAHRHGMHREAYVTESNFVSLDDERLNAWLVPRDYLLPPLALVVIHVRDVNPRRYRIRLQALRSFWRYRVLGEFDGHDVEVVDSEGRMEFEPLGELQIIGGRTAATFLSKETVPLSARGGPRFALHARSAKHSRALVERLPHASVANTRIEPVNGASSRVTDIYVNL